MLNLRPCASPVSRIAQCILKGMPWAFAPPRTQLESSCLQAHSMLVRVVVAYLQVVLDVYVGPCGWLFMFLDFYLLRFLGFWDCWVFASNHFLFGVKWLNMLVSAKSTRLVWSQFLNLPVLLMYVISAFILVVSFMILGRWKLFGPIFSMSLSLATLWAMHSNM